MSDAANKIRKPPPNLPSVGGRVKLRGRQALGVLRSVNPESNWSRVDWDEGVKAPLICHLYELEAA